MTSEGKLVRACLEYLALKGVFAWRNNTGATRARHRDKTRLIRYGKVGSGDIFGVLSGGRFMSIECKVGKNKPTIKQRTWAQHVTASGGLAIIVRNLDELVDALSMTE